jgi:Ala-tRNA(Pro) deacylase
MAANTVIDSLRDRELTFELLPHRRTETAVGEANALGVLPQETAKTLIVRTDGGFVRAVLPASERLDLHKLRDVLGVRDVELVAEADLGREYPEFELGAVPPFGGAGDRVLVDSRLAERETVVLEAGSHERSVRIRTEDLLAVTGAEVVDLSEEQR